MLVAAALIQTVGCVGTYSEDTKLTAVYFILCILVTLLVGVCMFQPVLDEEFWILAAFFALISAFTFTVGRFLHDLS